MRIFEITEAGKWPPAINGTDLAFEAQDWHHTPEDFDEGDIFQNISEWGTYHLKMVPLAGLKLHLFYIDDDLVDEFLKLDPATSPPIIIEPRHNIILDGNHRANAAAKRGDKEILAYVADPETLIPNDEEDDDEWHPDEEW